MGDRATACFFRLLGLAGVLLPSPCARALAGLLGALACTVLATRRAVVRGNMRRVLGPDAPERDVRRLTRRVFGHFVRSHLELGWARSTQPRRIAERLHLHNDHRLDGIRAEGRGLLFLLCHAGNWELAGLAYAQDHPIHVVVWRLGPAMEALLGPARERTGFRPLYTDDPQTPRRILEALNRGEGVVIMADSVSGGETRQAGTGEEAPLFGQPWRFPRSPIFFAERTGAALVPAFVRRDDGGHVHIHFEPEIPLRRTDEGAVDAVAVWRVFAAAAEQHLRRWPEQWMWMSDGDQT